MPRFRVTVAVATALLAAPVAFVPGFAAEPPPLAPLPTPSVGEDAPPAAFIDAALKALAAGRTGEAQEAIERAESRVLTRSVRPSQAGQPSQQPLIQQLTQARLALASGDRLRAATLLEQAAKNPEATGK
jgi:hypothetical protein